MKKLISSILILLSSFCLAEKPKHLVNLGPNCINSYIFMHHGLRFESLPLDWLVSPSFEGVYLAFEEDFQYFVDYRYLKYHNPGFTENSRYGLVMNHFFEGESFEIKSKLDNMQEFDLETFLECLEPVKIKQTRRVQRLLEILKGGDPVFLFRLGAVDHSLLVSFRDLLLSKYPSLDFTIVIADALPNLYAGLQNIRYFQLEYPEHDLQKQSSHPQWKGILQSLGILQ